MATKYFFQGKQIKLPGVYSTIKSGIKNVPVQASYGNILIIDNGLGAGYGGGSGIAGSLATGQDSVYQFDNIDDFRSFVKGGMFWLLAQPLFKPARGAQGVSKIYFAKAAATTTATLTFSPTGGGSAGGSFVLQTKDEGLVANGAQVSNVLTKGYCFTFQAGETDPTKFLLKYWVGNFKGLAADSIAYDEIPEANTKPTLLVKSPEFSNIQEVFDWAAIDSTLNSYFKVLTTTKTGTGAVTTADLSLITGNVLAVGGTETYSTANLSVVLDAVKDLDYTFVLCDKYGDNAQGTENGMILSHILTDAKFDKFMVVAGGKDSTKFTQTNGSIPIANYFNSDRVIVPHGGVKKSSQATGTGFRVWDALYKAAVVLGRICGLQPQVPITFKSIDIDGEVHSLTDRQKELCLDEGVLVTYYDDDFQAFTILQGINSLQSNNNLVNNDASSYSIQLKRIVAQINKELVVNAKQELLSQPYGVNRNTLSPEYIRDWTIGYLKSRVATQQLDNLIISFQDVSVVLDQDAYKVSYSVVPNSEITKVFFTGFLLN